MGRSTAPPRATRRPRDNRPATRSHGRHTERLHGGWDAPVWRVGGTVRRRTGPWTPAVHALLNHLEAADFDGAPRVLGIDDEGREVLTFVEGRTIAGSWPWPDWTRSHDALVSSARLLRRYHDAVADFGPPAGVRWRSGRTTLRPGEIIAHNDVGMHNMVADPDGTVHTIIDWDRAGPAPASWDLAVAAWQIVGLHHPDRARELGWSDRPDHAGRLRAFVDAYGLTDRDGFVALIIERLQAALDTASGDAQALTEALRLDLDFLRANASALQAALDVAGGRWTFAQPLVATLAHRAKRTRPAPCDR